MLLSDYDWAENGVLELARQIQSEYWALVAYSLFISITAFLDVTKWKRRDGVLPRGSEVPSSLRARQPMWSSRPVAHSSPRSPSAARTTCTH